mgnify:CR=1 FL=1
MADPTPSDPGSGAAKKETVRITLPPKPGDVPNAKRETIRIDVAKGQTMRIQAPGATKVKSIQFIGNNSALRHLPAQRGDFGGQGRAREVFTFAAKRAV